MIIAITSAAAAKASSSSSRQEARSAAANRASRSPATAGLELSWEAFRADPSPARVVAPAAALLVWRIESRAEQRPLKLSA